MNEYTLIWQITGSSLGLILACMFYSLGGRDGKWKRRIIASLILALTVNVVCLINGIWKPLMLAIWPILITSFSLGYGSDELHIKIMKRAYCALATVMAGLLMAFILGGNAWLVLISHAIVGLVSVYLGTKNPLPAAIEEFMICLVLNAFLITYPFVNVV